MCTAQQCYRNRTFRLNQYTRAVFAVVQLRTRTDIETLVGDFAFGVGIVREAHNNSPLNLDQIGWSSDWGHGEISVDEWLFFKKHQVALTGLLPIEDFLKAAYKTIERMNTASYIKT
jgi:hypothetical protein